jgi:hypothetical protein
MPRFIVAFLVFGTLASAQMLSPIDKKEADRFQAVVRATGQAGFTSPVVVGHGVGTTDAFFALLAGEQGKGALVIVREPTAGKAVRPVVLERDETPANLGIRGIEFAPFLGRADLLDVLVGHEPMMLETSRRFESHHVLRLGPDGPALACQFSGGSKSSGSKGIGAVIDERVVTVKGIAGASPLRFDVLAVGTTTRKAGRPGVPDEVSKTEETKHYEMPSSGLCRELPAGRQAA